LKKLDAIADQAEETSTMWLLERQIAHKTKVGEKKIQSNIVFTVGGGVNKKKKGAPPNGEGASKPMFPGTNQSPIASLVPAKRPTQTRPGNNRHVPWQKKKFCEFCNTGVVGKQCKPNMYLH
jgi:hypothetical protein